MSIQDQSRHGDQRGLFLGSSGVVDSGRYIQATSFINQHRQFQYREVYSDRQDYHAADQVRVSATSHVVRSEYRRRRYEQGHYLTHTRAVET